jgi:hypothetical protein
MKWGRSDYPNLTVKKIPKQVLSRCEWGHDDYSLRVENLPKAPAKLGQQNLFDSREDAKMKKKTRILVRIFHELHTFSLDS